MNEHAYATPITVEQCHRETNGNHEYQIKDGRALICRRCGHEYLPPPGTSNPLESIKQQACPCTRRVAVEGQDYATCLTCFKKHPLESDARKETVNHPPHYGGDEPYECIKVLAAWLTPEQLHGFCLGNAIKYLRRADKKGNSLEDLRKAAWYINYIIEHKITLPQ